MDIISSLKELLTKDKLLTRKNFFIALLIFDLYFTLYTVLKASSFSFMITDDFYDAVLVRDTYEGALLLRVLKVVYLRYMTHAGAFTCFFTTYLGLGLVASNEGLLAIFIQTDILLVIISLFLFINYLCNYIGMRDRTLKLCLYSGIIIPWFAFYQYKQIFFWFSACNQYCLGLAILLFTLSAFLRLTYKANIRSLIITSILAIICGGIYIIYIPVMVLFVVLLNLTELLKNKKLNIKLFIVSIFLALSTLINVIAPGYRLRKEDEIQISLSEGFKLAFKGIFQNEIPNILGNPIFLFFCIIAIYCGLKYTSKLRMNGIRLILALILAITMMVLSCFPVYMGYAYDTFERIPNRCVFTIDFVSYASILLLLFVFGIYLKQWSGITITQKTNAIVVLLLTLVFITHYSEIFLGNARYDLDDQVKHNNINYYRSRVYEVMDMMKNSPDEDVIVPSLPDAPPAILNFEIAGDPTVWSNEAMAAYYHKNSVCAQ